MHQRTLRSPDGLKSNWGLTLRLAERFSHRITSTTPSNAVVSMVVNTTRLVDRDGPLDHRIQQLRMPTVSSRSCVRVIASDTGGLDHLPPGDSPR